MIKVLFVYRGYGEAGSNNVIDFQRLSLTQADVQVDTFAVKGGGLKNYIGAIFQLRSYLKKSRTYGIIHAHYSFSGFIAGLATRKPVVCSLMGSDVLKSGTLFRLITSFFYTFVWKATIVKSAEMQKLFPAALLIPNGVDFVNFRPVAKNEALKETGFLASDRNIIFVAEDPASVVKNLKLAKDAIELLADKKVKLQVISGKTFTALSFYFNAADVLLLTSLSEGSPNVIKEAMACNCPVVATDVGDVRKVIGDTAGCFITGFDAQDVAAKLKMALEFNKRTNGRDAIQSFDSRLVAEKIVATYKGLVITPLRFSA